jgi:HlyD family secretion protein
LQAKLTQAERDWNRAKKLGPSDALAQADYDAALSGYEVAKANLAVGKAAIAQAQGTLLQSEAMLSRAQQNLDYCTIRSPVKGVIIDRRVNTGQTVVSSLNAPSLFLLAKDLTKLQVWVAVNEADIGNIRPGQQVNFTVDAFPGEIYQGEVGKVRLNASMTQNVVTYTVEITTDNPNGKLLPYLTANVKFLVSERRNVLMVPNAALRWTPRPEIIAPSSSTERQTGESQNAVRTASSSQSDQEGFSKGTVWLPDGEQVRAVPVSIGLSDGTMTEIRGPGVKEGTQVVIGEQTSEAAAPASGGSPFTPRFFGGGRGSGSGGGGRGGQH